jgi:hypothetical protein
MNPRQIVAKNKFFNILAWNVLIFTFLSGPKTPLEYYFGILTCLGLICAYFCREGHQVI